MHDVLPDFFTRINTILDHCYAHTPPVFDDPAQYTAFLLDFLFDYPDYQLVLHLHVGVWGHWPQGIAPAFLRLNHSGPWAAGGKNNDFDCVPDVNSALRHSELLTSGTQSIKNRFAPADEDGLSPPPDGLGNLVVNAAVGDLSGFQPSRQDSFEAWEFFPGV